MIPFTVASPSLYRQSHLYPNLSIYIQPKPHPSRPTHGHLESIALAPSPSTILRSIPRTLAPLHRIRLQPLQPHLPLLNPHPQTLLPVTPLSLISQSPGLLLPTMHFIPNIPPMLELHFPSKTNPIPITETHILTRTELRLPSEENLPCILHPTPAYLIVKGCVEEPVAIVVEFGDRYGSSAGRGERELAAARL